MVPLSISGAKAGEGELAPIEVPERSAEGAATEPGPGNVARSYARMARDVRTGSRTASTFDDAVGVQRLTDAFERSSASGDRVSLDVSDRPLPLPE